MNKAINYNAKVSINQFIRSFKIAPYNGIYYKDLSKLFSGALNYHFISILQSIYPTGNIIYLEKKKYFIFELNGEYYDIDGRYDINTADESESKMWEHYRTLNPTEYNRILREVVYMVPV